MPSAHLCSRLCAERHSAEGTPVPPGPVRCPVPIQGSGSRWGSSGTIVRALGGFCCYCFKVRISVFALPEPCVF